MSAETETETEPRRANPAKILHPEFRDRLTGVANVNPAVPPLAYGRLGWFSEQFAKRGIDVSKEMIRKYFAGENRPKSDRMAVLAEILQVDEAWLALGKSPQVETKQTVIRNAQVSGAVNVVAGLIQMHGGTPAFPEENDFASERQHIDLYAIIRGARYAMHVAVADRDDAGFRFPLPPGIGPDVLVLGLIQTAPLCFEIVELDPEGVAEHASRGVVKMDAEYQTAGYQWRRVETFAKRL